MIKNKRNNALDFNGEEKDDVDVDDDEYEDASRFRSIPTLYKCQPIFVILPEVNLRPRFKTTLVCTKDLSTNVHERNLPVAEMFFVEGTCGIS